MTRLLTPDVFDLVGHHLVENVEGPIGRLLGEDPSFVQLEDLDIGPRQFAIALEVDADKFSLGR